MKLRCPHCKQFIETKSLNLLEERLRNYIEEPGPLSTPCWICQYTANGSGHCMITRRNGESWLAHRASYDFHIGPIPKGMLVLHHCDNPACINPDHLYAGTQKENVADMYRRGRESDRWGDNNPAATLTNKQVSLIKFFIQQGWSMTLLAERYKVSVGTINNIVAKRFWGHIQPYKPRLGQTLPVPPPPVKPYRRP